MEYQKKARRGQLCILIYVLLIFVCSFISNATSNSSSSPSFDASSSVVVSASNPLSPSQTRSSLSASQLQQQPPQQPPPLPAPQLQPSHQALSRQALPENSASNTQTNLSTLLSSSSSSSSPPPPSSSSSQSPPSSSSSSPTTTTTITTTATASSTIANKTNETGRVCGGIHIRNDLRSFQQLEGCRIINGPLIIALVSKNISSPRDYDDITFPLLTEVTDYLLFFRVSNLTTLSKLFPNLRVIRGRELVSNYALIIYEMMNLQRIDLPNLTDILRGSVRIENNPNLCYASTINWEGICKHKFTPHFIKDNSVQCNNRCPDHCRPWGPLKTTSSDALSIEGDVSELGADNNRSLFCWNGRDCHESCDDGDGGGLIKAPGGGCCSPLCAGGCYQKNRPDQCITCRYVSYQNKCVASCDSHLFELDGQCLDKVQCEQVHKNDALTSQCSRGQGRKDFKAVRLPGESHGRCQENCPPGFEEDPTNKHRCKPCDKGKCRKVCTPQDPKRLYVVTDINSLRELSECNVINGSLEISMKGGKHVVTELEKVFEDLEEIAGYLKITRSHPVLTLEFFRSLKFINGTSLDRGQYSLVIIDNPNLQELFQLEDKKSTSHKHLAILGGKIFVHLNPKLCPQKIESLKQYATVADWDEQDVSIHNNGDKQACNVEKLEIELDRISSTHAVIKIQNFAAKLDDPRSLLFYLILYRPVENGTITMFDGRDGCNSQNDVWTQHEEIPTTKASINNSFEKYQNVIIQVRPATRYGLYVKTFTILAGSKGALSEMIYFETAPDTPSMPRELKGDAISHEAISMNWLPPSKPNGKIVHYILNIKKHTLENQELQSLDVCDSIINRDTITKTISKNEPNQSNFVPLATSANDTRSGNSASDGSSSPPATSCAKMNSDVNLEIQESKVTFQDIVIDLVFLKNTCPQPSSNRPAKEKKKRSIEHDPAESDSENSLPRKSINSDQSSSRASMNNDERARSYIPMATKFNKSSFKTEAKVFVPQASGEQQIRYLITGLEHYSLYEIDVVACHGDFNGIAKLPGHYNKCSLSAVTQVRTKAILERDRVNSSTIMFSPANETSGNTITWEKPSNPNGLSLAFRVRYRLKNSNQDVWNEVCINNTAYKRDHGLKLSNIGPGEYVLSVQTISMYTEQRLWSDEIEFEIPQTSMLSPLTWTLIIICTIIGISLAVALGAYYSQKKARDDLIYASVNPDYVQYKPDEWEVDKSKLIVGAQIGTGSFGMVYKGQLITEKGMRECAVKTVPPTSTAKQRFDFLREASIMKQFDTFHVVKLLGVVSVTTPVYVIMEYMENGDLKDFLRNQREIHQRQNKVLVDGIYLMAAQIADGMAYLASKKFVHRDLAARNCMVGENRIVKVGDFGLTRDIYANDYYRRDTQGRLPVRWMAPESLNDNICTSASDAWSYGIVLWEIVTFSAYPYQGLSNDEVIKRVVQGYTMPRPAHCPDKLFYIMERCWRKNDKDRPNFLSIVEYLLPETEGKLYPNCYYRKPKVEGDSIAHTIPDDSNTGTESYPLLSWPTSNRANGLTNGDNHIMNHDHSSDHGER